MPSSEQRGIVSRHENRFKYILNAGVFTNFNITLQKSTFVNFYVRKPGI